MDRRFPMGMRERKARREKSRFLVLARNDNFFQKLSKNGNGNGNGNGKGRGEDKGKCQCGDLSTAHHKDRSVMLRSR